VKLPAYRAGLPGNEISFLIVPLAPAYKAGLAGHLPVNGTFLGFREILFETMEKREKEVQRSKKFFLEELVYLLLETSTIAALQYYLFGVFNAFNL
jgi:hypothetical protein